MSAAAPAPLRFVVLHHTGVEPPHFDLMYESYPGSPLITVRFTTWPATSPGERLPDHRREYLDYEGPVSHNRGAVRRMVRGTYEIDRARGVVTTIDEAGKELELPESTWEAMGT